MTGHPNTSSQGLQQDFVEGGLGVLVENIEQSGGIITEQHNERNNIQKIEPKDGQRCLLCCNKKLCRCPFLGYIQIENQNELDRAFDYLFEEIIKL